MTQRERFNAIFSGKPYDRLPVYFFGMWDETHERWLKEGYSGQVEGLDADWEAGMWDCHGLANTYPRFFGENKLLEETDDYCIMEHADGSVVRYSKGGSTVNHTIKHVLKPTREAWEQFKPHINLNDDWRNPPGWEEKAAEFAKRERVATFLGGSFYGWLRGWMGVEELSCLMYDDPGLLEEMVSYIVDFCIAIYGPVAKKADFDFVYIFEDCCGSYGPLFSPTIYREIFDKHYKRLIRFYKEECKIPFVLIDSDGLADDLIPCWVESGFDIIFPIEVGKWQASPNKLREKFGEQLGMFGGVDKHLIEVGGETLRTHLESLLPAVRHGKYLPIPDHRIPPSVSYEQFLAYIKMFNEVFNGK